MNCSGISEFILSGWIQNQHKSIFLDIINNDFSHSVYKLYLSSIKITNTEI